MKIFVILLIAICFTFSAEPQNKPAATDVDTRLNVVVIDPGHGGKDWGANYSGIKEKDIVLAIGMRVGKLIEETYPDVKVIYTRKTDVLIPLHERARIANKNKADLFISIHANAGGVKSVSGTETFVLGNSRIDENLDIVKKENSVILLEDDYSTTYEGFDPNSSESYIMFETIQGDYLEQSLLFASFIQNHFKVKANRVDRGVKQNIFLVLRETTMPSVLVETGFISNEKERLYLVSDEGKENISNAIFKAFTNYKDIVERKSVANNHKTVRPSDSVKENKTGAESSVPAKKDSAVAGKVAEGDKTLVTKEAKNSTPINPPAGTTTNQISGIQEKPKGNPDSVASEVQKNQPIAEQIPAEPSASVDDGSLNIWFSVQLAISTKPITLVPGNFKGEKNIYSLKLGNYYKYYSGKFKTYEQAAAEKNRLASKFADAFIVAFNQEQPIPVKEAIEKTNK